MNVLFRAGLLLFAAIIAYALFVVFFEAGIPAVPWAFIWAAAGILAALKGLTDWPTRFGGRPVRRAAT